MCECVCVCIRACVYMCVYYFMTYFYLLSFILYDNEEQHLFPAERPLLPHKSGYSAMTKTVSVCEAPLLKLLGVLIIAV